MSDLRELYQEVILDHSKHPRHFQALDDADLAADGHNPLCGDKITVYVRTADERVERATFEGSGCAISMASASMMTEAVRGKSLEEVEVKFQAFHDLVTGKLDFDAASPTLGKLAIFAGVCKFPVRVKCATLAWHTLRAALERRASSASTEDASAASGEADAGTDRTAPPPPPVSPEELRERVIDVLRTCYDPEIPVDIYELGLIYDVEVQTTGHVDVRMTLTSPACPVAGSLPGEVEHKVRGVDGVSGARVELVWDPPWDQERMTEAARLKLGFF